MIEILRITNYLYEFKRNRRGTAPIYCKLTTDGTERQQFSTGLYVTPDLWDKDAQCVRGTTEEAAVINRRLQDITVGLKEIERKLYEADGNISLAEIVGVDKKLTHHTARKTSETTILRYNDVPIEVVINRSDTRTSPSPSVPMRRC